MTVTDSTQITGTWASKTAYSSASDIVIYVSNSDTDYAKSASSILGTQANPDIDLPTALLRAQQMVAPYTTKSDGSNLRVNIVLYKGDHYMLRKNIVPFLGFIDSYSYNYEIKITPMYWTTFPTDTTHWYTTGTDQVMNEFVYKDYFIVRCKHSIHLVLPGFILTTHSFKELKIPNISLNWRTLFFPSEYRTRRCPVPLYLTSWEFVRILVFEFF